jgi:ribosomal-protein-alanine N-acetyltransferase
VARRPAVRGLSRALARGRAIFLRRPTRRDCNEFLARVRASRDLHRGWVDPVTGPEAFYAYVRRARATTCDGCLVCGNEDGAIAGMININEIVRGSFQSGYLGYFSFEPFAGKGCMREALELTLRRAFNDLDLHRLEANIQPENARSIALVKGLGFRFEGFSPRYVQVGRRWRDHERWAITLEDWVHSH